MASLNTLPKRHLVSLPLPSGFDLWLTENYFSVYKDSIKPSCFQWGDIPSDQVLCTVQLSGKPVSLFNSFRF